jgi:hypothetical protein
VGTDSASESTTFTVTVKAKVVTVAPTAPTPATPITPTTFLPPPTAQTNTFGPTDTGEAGEGDQGGNRPDAQPARVAIADFAAGAPPALPTMAAPAGGSGPGSMPAAPFAQSGAAAPLYAGGERHPLPPVLPLDQTLPVAGFSDSGGDNFALVDMIYRGAAPQPAALVTPVSHATPPEPTDAPAPRAKDRAAAVAAAPPAQDSGSDSAAPPAGPASESTWREWVAGAGAVAAVAAVAGMRLSGGPNWLAGRLARRLLRALHRRPTERTA